MRVSVFGLGYVGCVSGACLAELGHDVVGVDVNCAKVEMINEGRAPIVEIDLPELITRVTSSKQFTATSDWRQAVGASDIALVCVGTPSSANGSISKDVLRRVTEQIGTAMAARTGYFVVAIRSTVLPGTVEGELIPILEKFSGQKAGQDFGVCMIPEFLREGTSVADFFNPPKTVIGQLDERSGTTALQLFATLDAPFVRAPLKVAETLKYADNAFHALKVTFANEIGNICKAVQCDSHQVMEIFCMDRKLNLSPYYLKPGFAFGGSCLPKDLRALTYHARTLDIPTPLLEAILESNHAQVAKVVTQLQSYKGRSLGFLGLSFKHGTDDLRESPILQVIETMIGKGFAVSIYDRYVSIAKLTGSNKEFIEREIPHVSSLMRSSAADVIRESDVIVISNASAEFKEVLLAESRPDQVVIDLVRILPEPQQLRAQYDGICW